VTAKRVPSDKIYHDPVEALKASGLKDGDTLSAAAGQRALPV
jgi:hypothetical protein